MRKIKIFIIALLVAVVSFVFMLTAVPIYHRIYPFSRFTINYSIMLNGENVECSEQYYYFEEDKKTVLDNDKGKFKIKGGDYGIYNFGLVADNEEMYNKTNDEYFMDADDLDFKFVFFNTNSWHIADIDVDIQIKETDGEWYATCYVEYTYPHIDETGRRVTESKEEKIKLDDLKETEIHFEI